MKIDFAKLTYQYNRYKEEIDSAIEAVLRRGDYILGKEVGLLEQELASFVDARDAITCASGTDALLLAMLALDIRPGDEVITTPFTFIATAETIALLGAKPVFVDIDPKSYNIDATKIKESLTKRTKGIISVSLYGQPSDLAAIDAVAKEAGLWHIIDGAQSFGARFDEKMECSFGDIYTTSFFPAKPLGCFGDGGALFTNDTALAQKIKMLRIHGQERRYRHKYIGLGARMDTIQCAVVLVKLRHYGDDLAKRRGVASKYDALLKHPSITLPYRDPRCESAWAQYSIQVLKRDTIHTKLKSLGIPTAIHYPLPLHLQESFSYLGFQRGDFPHAESLSEHILSLPMNPYLSDEELEYIATNLLALLD